MATENTENIKESEYNQKSNLLLKKKFFSKYDKYYANTEVIPATKITNYMKKYYNAYKVFSEECEQRKASDPTYVNPINNLDSYFDTKDIIINNGSRQFTFESSSIEKNPDMSLYKLLAYSYYVKSRKAFEDNNYLENLKYIIGKDVNREKKTINGVYYDGTEIGGDSTDKYKITDAFYKLLISYFQSNGGVIDYNTINMIALLSAQSIQNFISDLFLYKIRFLVRPEDCSPFHINKNYKILIKPESKTMEYNYSAELTISKDRLNGQFMDLEYPCGNIEAKLLFDLTNDNYKFTFLKINYDLDKCGPEMDNMGSNDGSNDGSNNGKWNINYKYAIPAAGVLAAGIATPFLLGALGGKRRSKKYSTRKRVVTRKMRKNKHSQK